MFNIGHPLHYPFPYKSNTKDDVIIKLIRIFRTHKKVKPTITHMKMILFRLICLKTCLLLIPVLYAQNNYRPGFIITVQKDTIYGEIDYLSRIFATRNEKLVLL